MKRRSLLASLLALPAAVIASAVATVRFERKLSEMEIPEVPHAVLGECSCGK